MKLVFIHLLILLVAFAVEVQGQTRRTDTISVRFSMCDTKRGDTVLFNYPNSYEGLKRFFKRNLHYPLDTMQTISCKLFFIISKEGFVTDAWCAAGAPEAIANEVVRVAKRIGRLTPSFVKGKPVVTRVETRIVYFYEEDGKEPDNYNDYERDIVILMWRCAIPSRFRALEEDDEHNND